MDDHRQHWENTLLGYDFWKDAQEYEERLNNELNETTSSLCGQPTRRKSHTHLGPFWSPRSSYSPSHPMPATLCERTNETVKQGSPTPCLDLNLHRRFPFNLGPEQGPHTKEEKETDQRGEKTSPKEPETPTQPPTTRHRRHKLSMSDLKGVPLLRRNKSVAATTSRIRDLPASLGLGRRANSPSPTRPSIPWSPIPSGRIVSRILRPSPQKEPLSPPRAVIEENEIFFTPSHSASKPDMDISGSVPDSPCPPRGAKTLGLGIGIGIIPDLPPPPDTGSANLDDHVDIEDEQINEPTQESDEIATVTKPLHLFRGGDAWSNLPRSQTTLGLDIFWPDCLDEGVEEVEEPCLELSKLKPLCEFRNLRSLKIVGMMQSYQTFIWQAAWLNPDLEELELGMAVEPEISNKIYETQWKVIKEGWTLDPRMSGGPVYFGERGDGTLHTDIGYGEYLDKQAIEKAKVRAIAMGRTSSRLTIRKLTVSGFVVDADPFIQWFDPLKLRCIHFKGHCVDAGVWLPLAMRNVSIRYPKAIDLRPVPVGVLKINVKQDLEIVNLGDEKETQLEEVENFRNYY
ncbi:hypothetical protein N7540_010502 [Penicillium herquei]|nr:hypothetical protein N7540_010502 [Penicillium herquei]